MSSQNTTFSIFNEIELIGSLQFGMHIFDTKCCQTGTAMPNFPCNVSTSYVPKFTVYACFT